MKIKCRKVFPSKVIKCWWKVKARSGVEWLKCEQIYVIAKVLSGSFAGCFSFNFIDVVNSPIGLKISKKKVNFNLIYEKIPQRLLWLADLFKHRWSRATSTGTANHDNFLFIIVIFSIDTLTRWSNRSIGWVTNLRVWMDWHLKWLLCPSTLKINK